MMDFEDIRGESKGTVSYPKRIEFEETLKMSTYSLAFVVDRFETLSGCATVPVYDQDGNIVQGKTMSTPIAVHSGPGRGEEARFVLKMTIASWEFFTNQFRTNNPLKKLDVVSIENLPVLGSENWGIITLITHFMLVNSSTSFSRIQRIARLVCHEVVHQWFGNLVTMRWWNHLWIKEGMARYLEYVAIESLFPSWNFWAYFLRDIFKSTIEMDESTTTHPIEAKVRSPKEISHIFDLMSYGKGASVARMIAFHIGEESFWKGVHLFLKRFQYNCASTEDLYQCFDQVSGKEISSVMQDWVQRSGHPVLSVSLDSGNVSSLTLKQEICFRNECGPVFLHSKKVKTVSTLGESSGTCYRVPIVIAGLIQGNSFQKEIIFSDSYQQINTPNLSNDDYLILNYRHSGFYRVCYDEQLLERLENAIKEDRVSLVELYGLVLDMFSLSFFREVAMANKCYETLPYYPKIDRLFEFIDRITQNCASAHVSSPIMQPIFWELVTKKLTEIWFIIEPDFLPHYKRWVASILSKIVNRIGLWKPIQEKKNSELKVEYAIEDKEIAWKEIRGKMLILLSACDAFSEDLKKEIMTQFNSAFNENNNNITTSDQTMVILQLGAQIGGFAAFQKLLETVESGTNVELRKASFIAMFASRDLTSLDIIFSNLTKEPEASFEPELSWLDEIVSQHTLKWNAEGRRHLWEKTVSHTLSNDRNLSPHILGMVYVSGDASALSVSDKQNFLQQLERMNHSISAIGFDRVFRPVVSNARENGVWARKNRSELESFFRNR
eukprot:TRINITY_DN3060_c0_g1_i4.p1 TRINITY_DN3060_c0_g1~~TRINITY_DN3060_c0_g1_i4.p1  ORF type:complete len:906 (+),score=233.29 TRINITY_DN3060_c0_g1_i4:379-2718(+)